MTMPHRSARDPLHGVTLEAILVELVDRCGWEGMGRAVDIRCFKFDPSIKSSLQFLRRTPWARAKVEELYLRTRAQSAPAGLPLNPKPKVPLPEIAGALDSLARLPAKGALGPADPLRFGKDLRRDEAARLRSVASYDRAALRAHTLNRAHAQYKSDNRSKV